MKTTTVTFLPLVLIQASFADYFTKFIRYEAQPEFSRIVITDEILRGHRGVDHFREKAKEYERRNLFHTYGRTGEVREITKVEKMDGHEIKTVIRIVPPRGLGFGGAVPTCSIKVFFDGILRADCSIGYNHLHSLTVSRIAIHPEEEIIEVWWSRREQTFNFMESENKVIRIGKP